MNYKYHKLIDKRATLLDYVRTWLRNKLLCFEQGFK